MARRRGGYGRLSTTERLEVRLRIAAGERYEAAAAAVGCSTKSVQRLLAASGGIPQGDRAVVPVLQQRAGEPLVLHREVTRGR